MINKGFDILLTHSPAYGLNDGKDLPHRGFQVFHSIINQYQPKFFVHGHMHMNYNRQCKRHIQHGSTRIINAYERCWQGSLYPVLAEPEGGNGERSCKMSEKKNSFIQVEHLQQYFPAGGFGKNKKYKISSHSNGNSS